MLWQSSLPIKDPLYVKWLQQTQKLSPRLRELMPQWNIQLLSHNDMHLDDFEKKRLNSNSEKGWQRVISHMNNQKALIIGRVVVPEVTFRAYEIELTNLKSRSIGEQLLFIDPNVTRSDFLFRVCKFDELETLELPNNLMSDHSEIIIARNSVFYLNNIYALMIEEYFLPYFFKQIIHFEA
ncbi:chorismate lyase [Thiotrichales bacterium 19S9-12]|nr:chorismate lyase [Thiotrichales bacterium 19S9-11]MCF6811500.1 chorismate lyase [Thiotrichales bacterium 19S9-12]